MKSALLIFKTVVNSFDRMLYILGNPVKNVCAPNESPRFNVSNDSGCLDLEFKIISTDPFSMK